MESKERSSGSARVGHCGPVDAGPTGPGGGYPRVSGRVREQPRTGSGRRGERTGRPGRRQRWGEMEAGPFRGGTPPARGYSGGTSVRFYQGGG